MSLRKLGHNSLMRLPFRNLFVMMTSCFLAFGCTNATAPTDDDLRDLDEKRRIGDGSKIFGDAFNFGPGAKESNSTAVGIAVNSFLWRASLDTISFMPLSSADPFGGVIITDWYTSPDSTRERFKVQVYILDRELRSDGLRVTVFRQKLADSGAWIQTTVNEQTVIDLENAILTRARQLRISSNSN